jgi:hypothetical protein
MKYEWENKAEGYQFLWCSLVFFLIEGKNEFRFHFRMKLETAKKKHRSNCREHKIGLLIIEVIRYKINLCSLDTKRPKDHFDGIRKAVFRFILRRARKLIKIYSLDIKFTNIHTHTHTHSHTQEDKDFPH